MAGGMDMGGFLRGLDSARQQALAAVAIGVETVGVQVEGDAQEMTPVDTGALQASATTSPADVDADRISVTVGFNTEYAAAVHENLTAHHDVGQAKFLSAALEANAPTLGPTIADKLKAAGF